MNTSRAALDRLLDVSVEGFMRIVSMSFLLLLLGCSVPAQQQKAAPKSSRPTPEAAARAMVDTALPSDWVGGFENLIAFSPEEAKELGSAPRKFDNVEDFQERLRVAQYLPYIRPLFKDGKVQSEKLKQYLSRLNGLSLEAFGEWATALKTKCKDARNWMAAYEVMQVESFWAGDQATEATRKRTLSRLASITGNDGWSPAGSCSDNVMYILQTEALFNGDRFDADLFSRALPLASDLYNKRSAEVDARAKDRAKKK